MSYSLQFDVFHYTVFLQIIKNKVLGMEFCSSSSISLIIQRQILLLNNNFIFIIKVDNLFL
jgi:hypothetical protein